VIFFSGYVAKLKFIYGNVCWQIIDVAHVESNQDENMLIDFAPNFGSLSTQRLALVPIQNIKDFDLQKTKWVTRIFDKNTSQERWQANNDFKL